MAENGPECRRQDRGFTLVELMVVVLIISMASAIAIPLYGDAIDNSREKALKADCRVLYNAFRPTCTCPSPSSRAR